MTADHDNARTEKYVRNLRISMVCIAVWRSLAFFWDIGEIIIINPKTFQANKGLLYLIMASLKEYVKIVFIQGGIYKALFVQPLSTIFLLSLIIIPICIVYGIKRRAGWALRLSIALTIYLIVFYGGLFIHTVTIYGFFPYVSFALMMFLGQLGGMLIFGWILSLTLRGEVIAYFSRPE